MTNLSDRSYIDIENYAALFALKGSLLSSDITPAYYWLRSKHNHRGVTLLNDQTTNQLSEP